MIDKDKTREVADEMKKGLGLSNNLDNIKEVTDLFGESHKQLSLMDRIGFLPISVWKPDWTITTNLKKIVGDTAQTRPIDKKSKLFREGNEGDYGKKASVFNPHLAQMILSAYCPKNAYIYDAFGGGGTRGFIATAMKHRYLGIEVRQAEVDRIVAQQATLMLDFEIICADSTQYAIEPNAFDFSYSCPPYYDLEVYSTQADDISYANTYEEFMDGIEKSLAVTYTGLKKGALCVWVVGNFRDNHGALVHFSGDTIARAKKVGFILHDELIFWGASGAAHQRAGIFVANRKSVRVHEYLLVLRKP